MDLNDYARYLLRFHDRGPIRIQCFLTEDGFRFYQIQDANQETKTAQEQAAVAQETVTELSQ